jgi:hypothetical protein
MRPAGCFGLAEQGFGPTETQTCSPKNQAAARRIIRLALFMASSHIFSGLLPV